jgi:polyisoprenoid-binding protein YceI
MSARTLYALALAAALLGTVAHPAFAQTPPTAQLVASGSEITFTTRQMGVPVDGKFGQFSAQVALDPKKPETGRVAFSINTGSARFGAAEIDAEVPKDIWLDTRRHPQATFESSAIKAAGAGRFEVTGKLSIKGQTREVKVPVTLTQAGATSTASGQFSIKRLDYKVGEGDWTDTSLLANEVIVRFKLALTGLPAL